MMTSLDFEALVEAVKREADKMGPLPSGHVTGASTPKQAHATGIHIARQSAQSFRAAIGKNNADKGNMQTMEDEREVMA